MFDTPIYGFISQIIDQVTGVVVRLDIQVMINPFIHTRSIYQIGKLDPSSLILVSQFFLINPNFSMSDLLLFFNGKCTSILLDYE